MSDGLWNAGPAQEAIRQGGLTRHRVLVVNCGQDLTTGWNAQDASGMASLDPNSINPGTVNAVTVLGGPEGGPHFVMSPDSPDGSKTYGFEFCLFTQQLATPALPAVSGGYSVTVWALITNTQSPIGQVTPIWAAFGTRTGVQVRELYNSFDINAQAIRFQFANLLLDPVTNNRSIGILFSEL